MTGIRAPQEHERQGDDRRAVPLVARAVETDRIHAFIAAARAGAGRLLLAGERGVGSTELLTAASATASTAGTRIHRAAGVEFEVGLSHFGDRT